MGKEVGKVYTRFQAKTAQTGPTRWGGKYLYGLFKGVRPPPPGISNMTLKDKTRSKETTGTIHSTKIFGNFGPKPNGSVRSNRKSFEKTGPPFEVDHFSRSDRLELWLNGSRPTN